MYMTVLLTSKALAKASPRQNFDNQQNNLASFSLGWLRPLPRPPNKSWRPLGQQTYGLFCDSESGHVSPFVFHLSSISWQVPGTRNLLPSNQIPGTGKLDAKYLVPSIQVGFAGCSVCIFFAVVFV